MPRRMSRVPPRSENEGEASVTYLSVCSSSTGTSSVSREKRSSAMAAGIICSSVVPSSLTSAASTMGLAPWVSFSCTDTDMARSGAS